MINEEIIQIDIDEEITTVTNCPQDCNRCKTKYPYGYGHSGPPGVTGYSGCTDGGNNVSYTGYTGDILCPVPKPKYIKPINRIRTIDRQRQWLIMRRF